MTSKNSCERRIPASEITYNVRTPMRVAVERLFAACRFLYYLFYWENNAIKLSRYDIVDEKIPQRLGVIKLAQLSDLHGKVFGERSQRLFDTLAVERPDVVLITGDLIDERVYDLEYVADVTRRSVELAPTLYVTGNHEANFKPQYFERFLDVVVSCGAIPLDGKRFAIERRAGRIALSEVAQCQVKDGVTIAGVADPVRAGREYKIRLAQDLAEVAPAPNLFSILLSHRPETFELYARHGFDLIFSGHAHGGQFRLPAVLPMGLNAPHQGWFPRYTGGLYLDRGARLIVSRGLGPSVLPTRLFNRPDLVVCRLARSKEILEG